MIRARFVKVLIAAGAVAVIPALAFAQGDDQGVQQNPPADQDHFQQPDMNAPPSQQGQQQGQMQQGQQQEQKEQGQIGGTGNEITKPMKLSENLSFPEVNNCQYTSKVSGTIRPVKSQKGQQAQLLSPNLHVDSTVSCANEADRKVSDTITSTKPMTRDELLSALDRRASISTGTSEKSCLYMPDFDIQDNKLVGQGVAYLCPIEQQQPQQNQQLQPGQQQQQPAQPQPGQQGMR